MQGEAPLACRQKEPDELSHFDRFLEIYHEFEEIEGRGSGRTKRQGARPSLGAPRAVCQSIRPRWMTPPLPTGPDTSATQSREWANLFNLRYRMLLRYLAHTFRLARVDAGDPPNLRAMVMHRVFGEMYNLKTIAGILWCACRATWRQAQGLPPMRRAPGRRSRCPTL